MSQYFDYQPIVFQTDREWYLYVLGYLGLPLNRWGAFRWWLQGGTFSGMLHMWRIL